jgi:hypothetical protein
MPLPLLFFAVPTMQTSPIETVSRPAAGNRRLSAQQVSELSDAELNARIEECSELMLNADLLFCQTGEISYAGERDSWWLQERLALTERGRRPGVVAALEQAKGLA